MKLEALLSTTPATLAAEQHKALTEYAIERLNTMAKMLNKENYIAASQMIEHSSAGDGYGEENDFLTFPALNGPDEGYADIGTVIALLTNLQKVRDGK